MAKVRFVGDSNDVAWLGVGFPRRGEWVECDPRPEDLNRFNGHPHFEVAGQQRPGKPAKA